MANNDYSYLESAYGRGTTNALGRAARNRTQREEDALSGLLGAGGGADQYLKLRQGLHKEGLGQDTDILTQGNMAQAGALFRSGESAKARDFESSEAERMRAWQTAQGNIARGWDVEDRNLEAKLAKTKMWLDFGGDMAGLIPGLAGMFGLGG